MTLVYKVCSVSEWEEANKINFFLGSAIDIKDGFIHLSTKDQLEVTVSKHFAGQTKLLLIGFDIKVIKSIEISGLAGVMPTGHACICNTGPTKLSSLLLKY
jgi:uncharacterized protein (DUF952 family)